MFRAKAILIVCILLSTVLTPTAAFATTGNYYSENSSYQWLIGWLRYFGEHKELDEEDYAKIIKWYSTWKDYTPTQESIDIWRDWYCS